MPDWTVKNFNTFSDHCIQYNQVFFNTFFNTLVPYHPIEGMTINTDLFSNFKRIFMSLRIEGKSVYDFGGVSVYSVENQWRLESNGVEKTGIPRYQFPQNTSIPLNQYLEFRQSDVFGTFNFQMFAHQPSLPYSEPASAFVSLRQQGVLIMKMIGVNDDLKPLYIHGSWM